jgi:hypothetical protein
VRWLIERRLRILTDGVRRALEELRQIDAELEQVGEEAEQARIRALVADDAQATHDGFHAQRSADTLVSARASVEKRLSTLRAQQDELLDKLGNA